MIPLYPKIHSLGSPYITDLLDGNIEITEKIDGSFIAFGKIDGELYIRSKSFELTFKSENVFSLAVSYITFMESQIPNNIIFYGEYLSKPKHNVLKYERVPKNNIILFGCARYPEMKFIDMHTFADELGLECVPVLFRGSTLDLNLPKHLETDSVLGGVKIEGIVVKNYAKKMLSNGHPTLLMAGKYVSEAFKEVHKRNYRTDKTQNRLEEYVSSFRTEARWLKAIQHLKDEDQLTHEPKDIGPLLHEIKRDVFEEEGENIKNWLLEGNRGRISGIIVQGFPEFYKHYLAKSWKNNQEGT